MALPTRRWSCHGVSNFYVKIAALPTSSPPLNDQRMFWYTAAYSTYSQQNLISRDHSTVRHSMDALSNKTACYQKANIWNTPNACTLSFTYTFCWCSRSSSPLPHKVRHSIHYPQIKRKNTVGVSFLYSLVKNQNVQRGETNYFGRSHRRIQQPQTAPTPGEPVRIFHTNWHSKITVYICGAPVRPAVVWASL